MTTRLALIILDGFGHRAEQKYNAIAAAQTPTLDRLYQACPNLLIQGSGQYVGLPDQQMGNSEVGHLTIGAGRVISQELTRINHAIAQNELISKLPIAFDQLKANDKALHIMGLLSDGGVHSHIDHILALIKIAQQAGLKKIYLHAFLDGRDTPPQSAEIYLRKIVDTKVHIAAIIGRYYAMDRDQRWDRIQCAYQLLQGHAPFSAPDAFTALQQAYARGETDEFVQATTIISQNQSPIKIEEHDTVIFMNFRADRARQLTYALVDSHFKQFQRSTINKFSHFITLTQYASELPVEILFPPQSLKNILGEYLANLNLKQFRIAETEKYAHVTYFFNGGRELPFTGEDRLLIPSLKVATYDEVPAMSAWPITDGLINAMTTKKYSLMVCNFANADMVGHTGNFAATAQAISILDQCLFKIINAAKLTNTEIIITADHGNAECMYDEMTKQPHTAHTTDPVPFIYVGREAKITQSNGTLADVAPTILKILGLAQPVEMTGTSLLA